MKLSEITETICGGLSENVNETFPDISGKDILSMDEVFSPDSFGNIEESPLLDDILVFDESVPLSQSPIVLDEMSSCENLEIDNDMTKLGLENDFSESFMQEKFSPEIFENDVKQSLLSDIQFFDESVPLSQTSSVLDGKDVDIMYSTMENNSDAIAFGDVGSDKEIDMKKDQEFVEQTDVAESTAKEKNSENCNVENNGDVSDSTFSASEAIQKLDQINEKLTKDLDVANNPSDLEEYNRRLSLLPENVREKIEALNSREYPTPRIDGEWSGEVGNSSFTPADDVMPKNDDANYNPNRETLVEYMRENCNGHDSIEYINGEPDFKPLAHSTYEMETDQETLADRKKYQAEARKLLAEEWGLSSSQEVKARLDENHLTIHENPDGRSFSLVKYPVHESFAHAGGVSKAQKTIVGGALTESDFKASMEALDKI